MDSCKRGARVSPSVCLYTLHKREENIANSEAQAPSRSSSKVSRPQKRVSYHCFALVNEFRISENELRSFSNEFRFRERISYL